MPEFKFLGELTLKIRVGNRANHFRLKVCIRPITAIEMIKIIPEFHMYKSLFPKCFDKYEHLSFTESRNRCDFSQRPASLQLGAGGLSCTRCNLCFIFEMSFLTTCWYKSQSKCALLLPHAWLLTSGGGSLPICRLFTFPYWFYRKICQYNLINIPCC